MKNPYDGMTLADMAVMFGPATCGCVPFEHSNIRETLTFAQMDKIKERRGWARCPICKGSGVDPRIVYSDHAIDALLGAASCR